MRLIRHNIEGDEFPQYNKKTRSTVVFDKPHVLEVLQEMRRQFTKSSMQIPKITVNIGCALAHPKDNFSRKVGIKLAESRIKPIEMEISSSLLHNSSDAIELTLQGIDTEIKIHYSMKIKIYRDSGELRVMSCNTEDWQ